MDRPTSGVLFSESVDCAAELQTNALRQIRKEYLAIVRGWVPGPRFIDTPLTCLETGRRQDAQTSIIESRPLEIPLALVASHLDAIHS